MKKLALIAMVATLVLAFVTNSVTAQEKEKAAGANSQERHEPG